MKTSRQRLMDYIKNQGAVTVAEISQALHMTEANTRHHLTILQSQGWAQVIGYRPVSGRGRPAQIFGPSQLSLGHNLDKLSSALLEEIAPLADEHSPGDDKLEILKRVATRLAARDTTSMDRSRHLSQRLYQAVERLNKLHYQARWEAHKQAPRIILAHCPYTAIIDQHPELCQIDAYLLEILLGKPVEQIARLAKDARGKMHCTFCI